MKKETKSDERLIEITPEDESKTPSYFVVDIRRPQNLHAVLVMCKGSTPLVITVFKKGVSLKAYKHAAPERAVKMIAAQKVFETTADFQIAFESIA